MPPVRSVASFPADPPSRAGFLDKVPGGTWGLYAVATVGVAGLLAATWTRSGRSEGRRGRSAGTTDRSGWIVRMRRLATHPDTCRILRESLVGVDRTGLLRLFGPPAASANAGFATRDPAKCEYRHAGVWYYPLGPDRDANPGGALAVRFEGNRVSDAELLDRPPGT